MEIHPKLRSQAVGGIDFLINCDYDRERLCYWQDFKYSSDSKEIPVYDQIIWNNRNIRQDGKTIFISEWYNKGTIYIQDLLNTDFNFLSLTGFKEKFIVQCPFTLYYGLIKAIPKTWKSSLRKTAAPANRLTPGAPASKQHYFLHKVSSFKTTGKKIPSSHSGTRDSKSRYY